jgi:hypothetical protein
VVQGRHPHPFVRFHFLTPVVTATCESLDLTFDTTKYPGDGHACIKAFLENRLKASQAKRGYGETLTEPMRRRLDCPFVDLITPDMLLSLSKEAAELYRSLHHDLKANMNQMPLLVQAHCDAQLLEYQGKARDGEVRLAALANIDIVASVIGNRKHQIKAIFHHAEATELSSNPAGNAVQQRAKAPTTTAMDFPPSKALAAGKARNRNEALEMAMERGKAKAYRAERSKITNATTVAVIKPTQQQSNKIGAIPVAGPVNTNVNGLVPSVVA